MWAGKWILIATIVAGETLCMGAEEPKRVKWTELQYPQTHPAPAPIPQNPQPPKPQKKKKPTPAEFLQDQIGAVVKIVPDGQRKSPMQIFLEKLVASDDRSKSPCRWLDEIVAIQPSKPDIPPRLPEKVLYYDLAAANGHWIDFQKRNPKTSAGLKIHVGQPNIPSLPGKDIKAFVNNWIEQMEMIVEGPDKPYFQAIGGMLLYADFLIARGDAPAKANAMELLKHISAYLNLYLWKHAKDATLAAEANMEIIWPLLDENNDRYVKGMVVNLLTALEKTHRDRDYFTASKWVINQMSCDRNFRELMFIERANAYGAVRDNLGVLLNLYAAYAHDGMDQPTSHYVQTCMTRKFRKNKGEEFYRQFMQALATEVKEHKTKPTKGKLP